MSSLSRQRWSDFWHRVQASLDPLPWFNRLEAAYSESHRHYHNFTHIAECLREFDSAKQIAFDPVAVELAIWFHDAVYDPKAQDNEERSAALAIDCINQAGVRRDLGHTVAQLVMATKHHDVSSAPDAPLVVDIDLTILGQPESRFWEYETQIRQEYAWVPVAVFKTKRAEILEKFLAREKLYATDWFHNKYEQAARRNLQLALERLKV